MRAPRISHDAAAVIGLIAALVTLFGDVITGRGGFYRSDLSAYHRPLKWVWAQLVRSGEFPWWNPMIAGGQPLAANPAYETFYPLQLPLLLPGFELWFGIHILLHILLAGLGMYSLLRSLGHRAPVAFLVALSFQCSGPIVATMVRLPFLFALAWVPLIVLFVRRWLHHRALRDLSLASMLIGLQALVGEPMTVLQTIVMIAGYATLRGWKHERWRGATRYLLLAAAATTLGALLASVQLLPGFDHARDSVRRDGFSREVALQWSTPPPRLAEIVWPALYRILPDAEGYQRISVMYEGRFEPYLPELYVGLLVVAGAIVGAASSRTRRRWPLLAGFALFVMLALATVFPLFRFLWSTGIFAALRYPEKFLLGAAFLLFLLAAAGLEQMLTSARARRGAMAIVITWLAVALVIHGASDVAPLESSAAFDRELAAWSLDRWTVANLLRGAGAIGILLLTSRRMERLAMVCAGVFVMLDLAFVASRHAPRQPMSWFAPPAIAARADGMGRVVNAAVWSDVEGTVPAHVYESGHSWDIAKDSMYPYRNLRWGIASLLEEDIDETLLASTATFNRVVMRARQRRGEWPLELLADSGVGGLIRYHASAAPSGLPVHVSALPAPSKYWFAKEIVEVADDATLADLIARGRIGRSAASVPAGFGLSAGGSVFSVSERPAEIRIDVDAEGRSLLVAAVTRHRYWRVEVDGVEVESVPVHGVWQGVPLTRGRHSVVLRYRNPMIRAGAAVSLITLFVLGTMLFTPALARTVISSPRAMTRRQR